MSDELIKIPHDTKEVQKVLDKLAKRAGTLRPALKSMGEYLAIATEGRFARQTAPDGNKWQEVTARTRKRKKHPKILTEQGHLRGSMHPEVDDDSLLFGTDSKYGAIHQLGGEIEQKEQKGRVLHFSRERRISKAKGAHYGMKVDIGSHKIKMPARPFLGVSPADGAELLDIAGDYLTG